MPTQAQRDAAEQLKEEGNKFFARSKFGAAVERYTEAITLVPDNAVLFVNRAMAHRKKEEWEFVMRDAMTALRIDRDHMKANYLAGLAHLQLTDYETGIRHLSKALEQAREANDSIKDNIWRELAQAKYTQWQHDSAQRKARLESLKELTASCISSTTEESQQLNAHWTWLLQTVAKLDIPREVPSVFTCPLTMETYRDPAITKYGQSYERGVLIEHLKKNQWDPVTRQPLTEQDIVPNIALRQAVYQYLDEHPWAWRECF